VAGKTMKQGFINAEFHHSQKIIYQFLTSKNLFIITRDSSNKYTLWDGDKKIGTSNDVSKLLVRIEK